MSITLCNPLTEARQPAKPAAMQKATQDERACQAARAGLLELGVSLAIGIAALPFTASVWAAPVIFGAIVVQTAANTALRYRQLNHSPSSIHFRIHAYLKPWVFSWCSSFNLQLLVHETGHALAANALFVNARPTIAVFPLWSATTTFCASSLSRLGKALGRNRAICLVIAMGPAYSLALSTILIVIGYQMQKKMPELSSYFVAVGRGDFFNHAVYAISALFRKNGPNDFAELAQAGLHPLAAAIGIIAIPRLLAWKLADRERRTEPICDPCLRLVDKLI